ncbi:MAG: YHS domain-containing protein [Phycisphaerae bacterium]|nr:YHS domain-containing protein [Saprospiraceae bacterium]
MKVDRTVEDTVHYGGKIYGFCGLSCKEDFQANPAKYVGK